MRLTNRNDYTSAAYPAFILGDGFCRGHCFGAVCGHVIDRIVGARLLCIGFNGGKYGVQMDAQCSLSLSNSGLVGIYLVLAGCVMASILANLYPGYRY